jgi:hypothetical protein
MDVAVVEQPLGDGYLNGALWDLVDEEVLGDRKTLLQDNGLRIGQVGGSLPPPLQALLTSERSCLHPRRIRTRAGTPTSLALSDTPRACRFEVRQDEAGTPVRLDMGVYVLEVVPALTDDGRTCLRFTPQVKYGPSRLTPVAAPDRSAWSWQMQQATEAYAGLSWEVKLRPNEFVLVGTRLDRPQSLGHQAFVQVDGTNPAQHLLVIRTGRGLPPVQTAAGAADSEDERDSPPPLALQAGWSAARGTAP